MNPWWPNFMKRMKREHDDRCVDGTKCESRDEHINNAYTLPALRQVIDHHPDAQADAVNGRPA